MKKTTKKTTKTVDPIDAMILKAIKEYRDDSMVEDIYYMLMDDGKIRDYIEKRVEVLSK